MGSTVLESRSAELGPVTLDYREAGQGEAVLFVHGLLVDGRLWDRVAEPLSRTHRVLLPDLPLGAHRHPVRDRSVLTPRGVAGLVIELLDALGIERATIVGNDTGGAISQVLVATWPERVERLVLTSSDAYENFLPPILRPVGPLLSVPGMTAVAGRLYRSDRVRRSVLGAGLVVKHPEGIEALNPCFDALCADDRVRKDMVAFVRACHRRTTKAATRTFGTFDRPVLIAWSREDRLFPTKHAERLAGAFPDAELTWVDDAYTFASLDQPARLTELLSGFLARTARATGAS